MQFGSLIFLFLFLPVVLFFGNILKSKSKKYFLVLAGFVFYFFGMGGQLLILLFSIIVNWIFGALISGTSKEKLSFRITSAGVILNILILLYYKYSGFILNNIESLSGTELPGIRTILPSGFPIGISFFTFVAISYLVDTHRNKDLVFKDPMDVAFIFSFFPKVFSGPITFHQRFFPEVTGSGIKSSFEEGAKRFVYGMGKKVLIADTLAKCVNGIFEVPSGDLTFGLAWVGVLTFTLQIFMDFSGYTDMAVGLGKMLGFNIPENFNYPYIAVSIRDFWKRWHITLSNWLQLYIFLPIAYKMMRKIDSDYKFGIKVENIAYYTASFITMLICGIWHGAEWTFLIWGLFHGFFLIIEHWKLGKFLKKKVWKPLRILYAMIVVVIGWGIFRAPDTSYAYDLLSSMFGFGGGEGTRHFVSLYTNIEIVIAIIAGILVSFPISNMVRAGIGPLTFDKLPGSIRSAINVFSEMVCFFFFLGIFIVSIMAILGGTYSPFIYFRF